MTRVSATEIDTEKPPSTSNSSSNCTFVDSDPEKEALPRLTIPRLSADIEKDGFSSPTESPASPSDDSTIEFPSEIPVMYGRPDVASLIHGAVDGVSSDKRVLVMGCGPRSLISTVRNVTAECITSDGPGVELHCEQFGW